MQTLSATSAANDMIRDAILTCAQKLTSQLNLLHRTDNEKVENRKTKKSKKNQICSEVSVNSMGNLWSQSGRRKGRLRWEGFAEKEGHKHGRKE